jgi:hypothetical protein
MEATMKRIRKSAEPTTLSGKVGRAPGQVIEALAARFKHLGGHGLLDVPDARRAASQFAYLIVGELLDHSVLVGAIPTQREIVISVWEGVQTFLARYQPAPRQARRCRNI